jgi:hypothetical protein
MAIIQARSVGAFVSGTPHSGQNLALSGNFELQTGQFVIPSSSTFHDIPYYPHLIIFSRVMLSLDSPSKGQ